MSSKEERRAKSNRNLRPAKKGEVRNPKGKAKGIPNYQTIYGKILNGMMTVEQGGRKLKRTRREIMCMQGVKDSMDNKNTANERTRARESIESRIEGKPFLPITGKEGIPLETPIINVFPIDGNKKEK